MTINPFRRIMTLTLLSILSSSLISSCVQAQTSTSINLTPSAALSISSTPTTVVAGGTVSLTWSSVNATTCTASGGWTGTKPVSGTQTQTLSAVGNHTYTLTCTGTGGGTITGSVNTTATTPPPPPPTVTINASPLTVTAGGQSTLTWSSTNATTCTASGKWSGPEAVNGTSSQTLSATGPYTYTLACTGVSGLATAQVTVTATAPPPPPPPPSGLAVSIKGNQFINAQGSPIQLRGVNLSGLEYTAIQGWDPKDPTGGQFGQPNAPNWAAIQSWKANIVRFPLNEASWLGLTCTDIDGNVHNADPGANYQAVVSSLVQQANTAGMYVILDLQWAAPGTICPMGQSQMANSDHSLTFWTSIANTFKSNPSVIFDLFNEPYLHVGFTGNVWSYMMQGTGGGPFTTIAEQGPGTGPLSSTLANPWWNNITYTWNIASFQAMINAVRATGSTNVVLVGGDQYSQDYSGWLANKPNDPLNQMAASWHAYPNASSSTPWQNPCTGNNTYCVPWTAPYVFTQIQGILSAGIPVLIGESGDQCTAGTVGAPLITNITTFADNPGVASTSTEPNVTWPAVPGLPPIGVLGWTWDVWTCNTASVLILDVNGTPTPGQGQVFHDWMVNHK